MRPDFEIAEVTASSGVQDFDMWNFICNPRSVFLCCKGELKVTQSFHRQFILVIVTEALLSPSSVIKWGGGRT